MRRREFISVIAGAAVWPLGARAEQPGMPLVGFLNPTPAAEAILHLMTAFRRGLAEADYVEGKNVAIEYRFTNFRPELPAAARDLVRPNMKVIFAPGLIVPQPTLAELRTFHSVDERAIRALSRPGRDGTPPGSPQARR